MVKCGAVKDSLIIKEREKGLPGLEALLKILSSLRAFSAVKVLLTVQGL